MNYKQAKYELEADAKRSWESDAALRKEFSHNFDTYHCYRAAEASGLGKVFEGKVLSGKVDHA